MKINNKEVSLVLSFPDRLLRTNKFVNFNSKTLLLFSYVVKDVDLEYAKDFVKYCNEYFGQPVINQLENEESKGWVIRLVSWDNSFYNIYSIMYQAKKPKTEDEKTFVRITFSTTDEQRLTAEKEF